MKTLGIDIGTTSIGWALVNFEQAEIIDMGVRIFPVGVDNYGEGENEQSKSAERRKYRGMRRQIWRRRLRKAYLQKWLKDNLYWPENDNEYLEFKNLDPYYLRVKALDEQLTKVELSRVIYHLNQKRGFCSNSKKGGETKTILKGDKDSGILGFENVESEIENGKVRTLGEFLYQKKLVYDNWLTKNEYITFGQYLEQNELVKERVRNRYVLRKYYQQEFDKIMEAQNKFHHLSEELIDQLKNKIIYYQRPLKSQEETIGECYFEKGEKRIEKSNPIASEFVIWQNLNQIKMHPINNYEEERGLTPDEKIQMFEILRYSDSFEVDKIAEKLKLGKPDEIKINIKDQKKLKGSVYGSNYKKILGKDFSKFKHLYFDVYNDLTNLSPDDFITKCLENGFTKDQALELQAIELKPSGYLNISKKAIEKLLPLLKEGKMYHEAAIAVYGSHSRNEEKIKTTGSHKYIPNFKTKRDADGKKLYTYFSVAGHDFQFRNPVVEVSLKELRKVVNTIISHYGKPDAIHIEMARDMTLPKDKRKELINKQFENRDTNQQLSEELKTDFGINMPSKSMILKYKLFKEQQGKCAYSGKPISRHSLFNKNMVQIDHILPISRSLKDGYMNKVLCLASENAEKSDRTPFEWLGGNKERWETIKAMASHLPEPKRNNLLAINIKGETSSEELFKTEIAEKHLNDTRYISKMARALLSFISPYDHIICSNGQYTSKIRSAWFKNTNTPTTAIIDGQTFEYNSESSKKYFIRNPLLDNIELHPDEISKGGKNRIDHRHHALDALIIACLNRSRLQNVAKILRFKKENSIELPWPNFIEDTKICLSNILVSFKLTVNNNGPLHNDTYYGQITLPKNSATTYNRDSKILVTRKKLTDLNGKQINDIVDPEVKRIVIARIHEFNKDWKVGDTLPEIKVEYELYGKIKTRKGSPFTNPLYHKNGNEIKSVRVAFNEPGAIAVRTHAETGKSMLALPETNHHAIVYQDPKTDQYFYELVKMLEVTKRVNKKEKPVKFIRDGYNLVFSIRANEMFLYIGDDNKLLDLITNKNMYHKLSEFLYRCQFPSKMSKLNKDGSISPYVVFRNHTISKLNIKSANAVDLKEIGLKRITSSNNFTYMAKVKIDPAGFIVKILNE